MLVMKSSITCLVGTLVLASTSLGCSSANPEITDESAAKTTVEETSPETNVGPCSVGDLTYTEVDGRQISLSAKCDSTGKCSSTLYSDGALSVSWTLQYTPTSPQWSWPEQGTVLDDEGEADPWCDGVIGFTMVHDEWLHAEHY